jgi:hypothetical protein
MVSSDTHLPTPSNVHPTHEQTPPSHETGSPDQDHGTPNQDNTAGNRDTETPKRRENEAFKTDETTQACTPEHHSPTHIDAHNDVSDNGASAASASLARLSLTDETNQGTNTPTNQGPLTTKVPWSSLVKKGITNTPGTPPPTNRDWYTYSPARLWSGQNKEGQGTPMRGNKYAGKFKEEGSNKARGTPPKRGKFTLLALPSDLFAKLLAYFRPIDLIMCSQVCLHVT